MFVPNIYIHNKNTRKLLRDGKTTDKVMQYKRKFLFII